MPEQKKKAIAHRVLVSLQIELDIGAPDAMAIVKNLKPEHAIKQHFKIHDMRFLLIKKQTEPLTQEDVDEAFAKRRQESMIG